jgi:hypothetical protein
VCTCIALNSFTKDGLGQSNRRKYSYIPEKVIAISIVAVDGFAGLRKEREGEEEEGNGDE